MRSEKKKFNRLVFTGYPGPYRCILASKSFDKLIISKKGFSQKEDISAGHNEPYKCVQIYSR